VAPVLLVVASSSYPEKFCTLPDCAPLLRVIGTLKKPLPFLPRGLLAVVSTVSSVLAITLVSYVNLAIILLP
jgi:hypothetical protein